MEQKIFRKKENMISTNILKTGDIALCISQLHDGDCPNTAYLIVSEQYANTNNLSHIKLNNQLWAIPINNKRNVVIYGADITGNISSSVAIQNCEDMNNAKTIIIPEGNYSFTAGIRTKLADKTSNNYEISERANLIANANIGWFFYIGGKGDVSGDWHTRQRHFRGGTFLCNNKVTYALIIDNKSKGYRLEDIIIFGFKETGIRLGYDIDEKTPTDVYINNCFISGNKSEDNNRGIAVFTTDNEIANTRIMCCRHSIYQDAPGLMIKNVHDLCVYANEIKDTPEYKLTRFIYISTRGGMTKLSQCYCDTQQGFAQIMTEQHVSFEQCHYYSYLVQDVELFRIGVSFPRVKISNSCFEIPKNRFSKSKGISFINNTFNVQMLNKSKSFILNDNVITGGDYLYNGDILMSITHNSNTIDYPFWTYAKDFEASKWLKVGYINTSHQTIRATFELGRGAIYDIAFYVEGGSNNSYLTPQSSISKTIDNDNRVYELAIGNSFNHCGYEMAPMYVRQIKGNYDSIFLNIQFTSKNVFFVPINTEIIDAKFEIRNFSNHQKWVAFTN